MIALMRKPRSLYGQIVLAQSLVVLVIAASLTFGLSYLLQQTADDFVDGRLHRDAGQIATALVRNNHGIAIRPELRLGISFDARQGSRSFGVFDGKGVLVASSTRALPPAAMRMRRTASESYYHHQSLNILILPVGSPSPRAWIVVAQDNRNPEIIVDDVIASFLSRLIWLVPLTIMSLLLLTAFVARQGTRAIARVSREADRIGPALLDQRLTMDGLPAEARPLAGATNRALDRLEFAYRSQSEFVSNVAHELRTPLALIALRAEAADDVLKGQLLIGVKRAARVIDQLMELASLENAEPSSTIYDLCEAARVTVEHYAPMVINSGRSIAFDTGTVDVINIRLPVGIVEIALGNLIDNASRHTPVGTQIIVSVDTFGLLNVADNGPGIAADERSNARKRYWRADTSRSDSAGLGLAIVERIMSRYGGALIIGQSAEGGASVSLTFKTIV